MTRSRPDPWARYGHSQVRLPSRQESLRCPSPCAVGQKSPYVVHIGVQATDFIKLAHNEAIPLVKQYAFEGWFGCRLIYCQLLVVFRVFHKMHIQRLFVWPKTRVVNCLMDIVPRICFAAKDGSALWPPATLLSLSGQMQVCKRNHAGAYSAMVSTAFMLCLKRGRQNQPWRISR